MFETLKVEETTTHSVVTASKKGNPFTIRAVVGTTNDKFTGVSFIEVLKGGQVVPAQAFCSDYGVQHSYKGEQADKLDALVEQFNAEIQEQYGITFLVPDPPVEMEEPQPPVEEAPAAEPAAEEPANEEPAAGEGAE